jgi:hypothetical protein
VEQADRLEKWEVEEGDGRKQTLTETAEGDLLVT